jgi:cytochrome c553
MLKKRRTRGNRRAWRTIFRFLQIGLPILFALAGAGMASAIITNLGRVDELHDPAFTARVDQFELREMDFEEIFEAGDVFFDTDFNALDGGGANVGNGQRFTRVPRADLRGAGQWFNHTPARITGPNAAACTDCHREPGDGAGPAGSNVHRDPLRNGNVGQFIQRNTPHLFGGAGIQVLAEEMTEEMQAAIQVGRTRVCTAGANANFRVTLNPKGIFFGEVIVNRTSPTVNPCTTSLNFVQLQGINQDLIVRPFQWKGSVATVRDFVRGASMNELGVQAVEITGANLDGDFDGVANEASVGDMTALAVYIAAQPRPTTLQELSQFGLIPALTAEQQAAINAGSQAFTQAGCESCHKRQLVVNDPVFSEPSQNAAYRDSVFPAGQNPLNEGLNPATAVTFDFTTDLFDNPFPVANGQTLGNFKRNAQGGAIIELFGDLKRHNMGAGLAEAIADEGIQASTFLTENLWGVATTAPYLHDGRATTLTEAILEHSGEAQDSFNRFNNLTPAGRANLIAFLENLVLFFPPEEE